MQKVYQGENVLMVSCSIRFLLVVASVCLIGNVTGIVAAQSKTSSAAKRQAARRNLARLEAMPPVRGIVFHCCSCSVPCPCMFNGDGKDIEGCNITRIYHFTEGGFEGKYLAGVTVVFIPHPNALKTKADGLRKDGKPVEAALYYSGNLTEHQKGSLLGLISENNMAIGWNTKLMRPAPISFRKLADGYDVEIPNVFHEVTHGVIRANGKPFIANNLKLQEGSRWHIGRSATHDYQSADEKAWHWKLPKTNGSWTSFAWGPHIDPSEENEANY